MKTQFTPGPWFVVTYDGSIGSIEAQNGITVAQAQQTHSVKKDPKATERKANAALISAAPDLYEALQYCVSVLSGEEMTKHSLVKALEKARFAFQKAQGER